jgi:hypothetical protein
MTDKERDIDKARLEANEIMLRSKSFVLFTLDDNGLFSEVVLLDSDTVQAAIFLAHVTSRCADEIIETQNEFESGEI